MNNHRHDDSVLPDMVKELCSNCDDGCFVAAYCDGCGFLVCGDCYEEHNNDAPCHVPDDS